MDNPTPVSREDLERIVEKLRKNEDRLNQIILTQAYLAQAQLDLNAFMNLVVSRMLQLSPATGATVELVEGDEMVYRAGSGSVKPFLGLRLKRENSISGLCVKQKEVMNSPDTRCDPRVDYAACQKVGATSMVVAPLFHQGEAIGVLKMLSREPFAFSQDDVQTLQMMAGLIGAAIGHQLSFETNQRLLAEREQEIDRRKQSEIDLRNSEERIRRILENAQDAYIGIDQKGQIVNWNPEAERTFGWKRDEAIGKDMAELIIPERFRSSHNRGMEHFHRTGVGPVLNQRLELHAVKKDGVEFPVEITISAIPNGDQWYFSAFMHDISERKNT